MEPPIDAFGADVDDSLVDGLALGRADGCGIGSATA